VDNSNQKYNLNACQTPRRPDPANPYPEGSSFVTANQVSNNLRYLSTPVAMSYTVSPANQVFVNYVAGNGAIYTLNTTNPSSDWGNWTRISVGQNSDCTQTLKLPPVPEKAPVWVRIFEGIVEIAIVAALPEAAGLVIDIGMAVAEPLIDDATEIDIYNGVELERACKISAS
jgi:hypothetical protein